MFGTYSAASFICVQLLQACILHPIMTAAGRYRGLIPGAVCLYFSVFPHLPIVLPNLRESTREEQVGILLEVTPRVELRLQQELSGSRVQAFNCWPVLPPNCVSNCIFMLTHFSLGETATIGILNPTLPNYEIPFTSRVIQSFN